MERSPELEALVRRLAEAQAAGDVDGLLATLSGDQETIVIGTDPDEWWTGSKITEMVRAQLAEMKQVGIKLAATDAHGFQLGDVGWVSDQSRFVLADGSEVNLRVTGVAVREDGDWKFVQLHSSVGARNEDVVGVPLTTR